MTQAQQTDATMKLQSLLDNLTEVRHSLVFESRSGSQQTIAAVVPNTLPDIVAEPGELLVEIPTGHRVSSVNPHETLFQYQEIFTHQIYTGNDIRYPKDAVVLDVGANIGMYTLFIAHHLPAARIIAFEPVASIRERLQHNVSRYAPNVTVLPYGLAEEDGQVEFTTYKGYSMMSSRTRDANAEEEKASIKRYLENSAASGDENATLMLEHLDVILAGRFEEEKTLCRLRRLSDVIDELGLDRVDVLKIDVQRAELDVLYGLEPRHLQAIGVIVMEIHDDAEGKTKGRVAEVKRLLQSAGFTVEFSQDENLQGTDRWDCVAVRPDRLTEAAVQFPATPSRVPSAIDRAGFEQWLISRLPEAIRPDRLVVLDDIPLTAQGKPDLTLIEARG